MDARSGVAREWTEHLLGVTFTPPRGMGDEGRTEWARDCQEAVARTLPHRSREELLEITDAARKRLRERAKTLAWPTVSEVVNSIREVSDAEKAKAGADGGWPHRNSEYVIESTIKRLDNFGEWPGYLEYPRQVAEEVMARTKYGKADLIRAGLRVSRAEAEAVGIFWGREKEVQAILGGFK